MEMLQLFKVMLIVQAFFSLGITIIAYAMPTDAIAPMNDYQNTAANIDLNTTAARVEASLGRMSSVPNIAEIGALLFYSGNIVVDLFLNFMFAIPIMIGLVIHGIFELLNIDTYMWALVEAFSAAIIFVLYMLGLIQMLASLRSGTRFV